MIESSPAKQNSNHHSLLIAILQIGLAVVSLLLSTRMRNAIALGKTIAPDATRLPLQVFFLVVGIVGVTSATFNLHSRTHALSPYRIIVRTALTNAFTLVLIGGGLYFTYRSISRLQVVYFGILYLILTLVSRVIIWQITSHRQPGAQGDASASHASPLPTINLALGVGGIFAVIVATGLAARFLPTNSTPTTDTVPTSGQGVSSVANSAPSTVESNDVFRVETRVVSNYANFPVAMAFAPDGRLFYTEKGGTVQVISSPGSQSRPVISFPTDGYLERGLLGIALDPEFEENHHIWVYHTAPPEDSGPSVNQVIRFTERGGVGIDPQVALSIPIPESNPGQHNGGNLLFGPDGMLYLSVGDFWDPVNAQDLESPAGKIHRFVPGVPLGIPADNPFPGSSIYALGLRNPFDFTFDPITNALFAVDNGPECDDEINLIQPGENYGWGENYACDDEGIDENYPYTPPLVHFTPARGITGIVVYEGSEFPDWNGHLLFCTWQGHLILAQLDASRNQILSTQEISLGGAKCQTDVAVGPDGKVYVLEPERIVVLSSVDKANKAPTPDPD